MWDTSPGNKYQLMRVLGGGWKRPHHCNMQYNTVNDVARLPRIAFVNCAPLKNGSEVRIVTNFSDCTASRFPTHISNIYPYFGKVGYCCTGIQIQKQKQLQHGNNSNSNSMTNCFAVGGEEGIIRIYDCHGLVVLQEMHLTGFIPVRAMTSSQCSDSEPGCGILVACGGKLTYSIWSFCPPTSNSTDSTNSNSSGIQFKLEVNAVKTWSNASQDHRLLSVSSVAYRLHSPVELGSETGLESGAIHHIIAMGDSRGVVNIVNYHPKQTKTKTGTKTEDKSCSYLLTSIECSEYPILTTSLEVLFNQDSLDNQLSIVGVFGDTNGTIFCHIFNSDRYNTVTQPPLWIVQSGISDPISIPNPDPNNDPSYPILYHSTREILRYEGHKQGVNCLTTRIVPVVPVQVLGLDVGDQNICISELKLTTSPDKHSNSNSNTNTNTNTNSSLCSTSIQLVSIYRRLGSSGSALKGISLSLPHTAATTATTTDTGTATAATATVTVTDSLNLVSVGYDRRLQLWQIKLNTHREDGVGVALGVNLLHQEQTTDTDTATASTTPLVVKYEDIQESSTTITDTTSSDNNNNNNSDNSAYIQWKSCSMVHIADVGGMHITTSSTNTTTNSIKSYIGVVGEGFELFEM